MRAQPATTKTVAKSLDIPDSLLRRVRNRPVVFKRNGEESAVLLSASYYQSMMLQMRAFQQAFAELEEDQYWAEVLNNMTPEEKKPIGVKKTQEFLDRITGGKQRD